MKDTPIRNLPHNVINPDAGSVSRRSFIGKSAVVVAGAMLASPAWGAIQGTDRKLRIGIVGGRFGTKFQFHEHPNCIVEAVSDLRAERRELLMKTYSCAKSYPSLKELLKDPKVEAVFIATPAPDHVVHTLQCLAAGKHVLSAVPAAMSLEECQLLVDAVKSSGLTYMMGETSYWQQNTISARKFYQEGAFGNLFMIESEYHHPGLEELYFENGERTWRHGLAPMQYPTHCTSHMVSVTGERLVKVSCNGWGDGHPILQDNRYNNPFWNETAFFTSDRGNTMRVAVWWRGAQTGGERARFYGDKMSLYYQGPNHTPAVTVHSVAETEEDSGGFVRSRQQVENYEQVNWWATDMLPEPLRHPSGHYGSHCFITHEFIDAVIRQRRPAVDVYEAIAYTAPGIVAHESALKDGELLKVPSFDPS